jgi:endoglucanase
VPSRRGAKIVAPAYLLLLVRVIMSHAGSVVAISVALFASGCILKESSIPVASNPGAPMARAPGHDVFEGRKLWVDPDSNASRQAAARDGAEAAALEKIATRPQATWIGDWNPDVKAAVGAVVDRAERDSALPVFVFYNSPLRDCGQYSAGGSRNTAEYRDWIRRAQLGIGSRPAVVVLEPDALGLLDKCLSEADQADRLALLKDAVRVLRSGANTAVYLDGGNANWMPAEKMAERLKSAGVADADGFALNVSNYIETKETVEYGLRISDALGGAHFVVDTSRNGNGATADHQWCNPDGRALGDPPTTRTADPRVDAYLWVKRPGESDGNCNGGPRAGEFWVDQALGLAKRAKF